MNEKARAKQGQVAQGLLPPGTQFRDYISGRGHFRVSTGAIVGIVLFGVAFVVALMLGRILIPGALLFIFVYYEVRPPVAVVVSGQGLAVLKRSIWTGKPTAIIALLPPAPIWSPQPSGSVTVELGPERVTFPRAEFDRLVSATSSPPYTAQQPAPGFQPGFQPGMR